MKEGLFSPKKRDFGGFYLVGIAVQYPIPPPSPSSKGINAAF